jgi:hypothetical protein
VRDQDNDADYREVHTVLVTGEDEKNETTTETLTDLCQNKKLLKPSLRRRTGGILVGLCPCGYIMGLQEIYSSETLPLVAVFIGEQAAKYPALKTIIYDFSCGLHKVVQNLLTKCNNPDVLPKLTRITEMNFYIDRFHEKGHKCISTPEGSRFKIDNNEQMRRINSEVAEQLFRKWSRIARSTGAMGRFVNKMYFEILRFYHNLTLEKNLSTRQVGRKVRRISGDPERTNVGVTHPQGQRK